MAWKLKDHLGALARAKTNTNMTRCQNQKWKPKKGQDEACHAGKCELIAWFIRTILQPDLTMRQFSLVQQEKALASEDQLGDDV